MSFIVVIEGEIFFWMEIQCHHQNNIKFIKMKSILSLYIIVDFHTLNDQYSHFGMYSFVYIRTSVDDILLDSLTRNLD